MQRARATITGIEGSPGVMTIYTVAVVENSFSAQLVTDRMNDALSAIATQISNAVTFTSDAFVDTIDPSTGTLTARNSVTPWTVTGGASSNPQLPGASQGCVVWRTGDVVNGRFVLGRTFIPGFTTGSMAAGGLPTTFAITTMNNFATSWLDAGLTDVQAAVWRRPVSGTGGHAGSAHVIDSGSVYPKWAVLRSRRD